MRRLTTLPLAVAVCTVVVLSACGDGDGNGGAAAGLSDAEQEYVDAAMATFDPEDDAPMTEDQAECMVTTMVSGLGAGRLEELGFTPESFGDDEDDMPSGLTEDEATAVVDGWNTCFDLSELFLGGISQDEGLSDEAKECLSDAFADVDVEKMFRSMLVEGEDALEGDEELSAAVMAAMSQCPQAMGG